MVKVVAIFFVALYNIILLGIIGFVVHTLLTSLLKKDED
jgi:preprotein translocase subunit Sss1